MAHWVLALPATSQIQPRIISVSLVPEMHFQYLWGLNYINLKPFPNGCIDGTSRTS